MVKFAMCWFIKNRVLRGLDIKSFGSQRHHLLMYRFHTSFLVTTAVLLAVGVHLQTLLWQWFSYHPCGESQALWHSNNTSPSLKTTASSDCWWSLGSLRIKWLYNCNMIFGHCNNKHDQWGQRSTTHQIWLKLYNFTNQEHSENIFNTSCPVPKTTGEAFGHAFTMDPVCLNLLAIRDTESSITSVFQKTVFFVSHKIQKKICLALCGWFLV